VGESEFREARLRPEFAHLYPGITPDHWMPAREMNELVGSARLGWSGRPGELLRGRMLDPRHFEFRGGGVRPPARQTRAMDTDQWKRVTPWWAAGISGEGGVRQACLRHEHAERYPLIPPGLWLPAKPIAGLLAGKTPEPRHQAAERRPLDPAHFLFRGGVDEPRAAPTRATDRNDAWRGGE
jgi:hypothetical protein